MVCVARSQAQAVRQAQVDVAQVQRGADSREAGHGFYPKEGGKAAGMATSIAATTDQPRPPRYQGQRPDCGYGVLFVVQIETCPPKRQIGGLLECPDHRPDAAALDQPTSRSRLPNGVSPLEDVRQCLRAPNGELLVKRSSMPISQGPCRKTRQVAAAALPRVRPAPCQERWACHETGENSEQTNCGIGRYRWTFTCG